MAREKKLPDDIENEDIIEEAAAEDVDSSVKKAGAKADKPTPSKKKRGLGKRFVKYCRDLKGEFKKIIWPGFPSVVRNTLVTLGMCAVVGIFVIAADFGLGLLVKLMLGQPLF